MEGGTRAAFRRARTVRLGPALEEIRWEVGRSALADEASWSRGQQIRTLLAPSALAGRFARVNRRAPVLDCWYAVD